MERVRAGESLLPLLPQMLDSLARGEVAGLELLDSLLKHLKRHPDLLAVRHHPDFVLGLGLPALASPAVALRLPAATHVRQLVNLVSIYHSERLIELARPEVLQGLQARLGDPGVDLDAQGRPLQPGGKLKIAELALDALETLPCSLEARFRGCLEGLRRVDAWMSLDLYQGQRLAAHLLATLSALLQGGQPFPDGPFLEELLELVNSPEYRQLPPEGLQSLVRWLPMRKPYWGPMFDLIARGHNPTWSDQLWALMIREPIFRKERTGALRAALEEGRLRPEQVPEELKPVV